MCTSRPSFVAIFCLLCMLSLIALCMGFHAWARAVMKSHHFDHYATSHWGVVAGACGHASRFWEANTIQTDQYLGFEIEGIVYDEMADNALVRHIEVEVIDSGINLHSTKIVTSRETFELKGEQ